MADAFFTWYKEQRRAGQFCHIHGIMTGTACHVQEGEHVFQTLFNQKFCHIIIQFNRCFLTQNRRVNAQITAGSNCGHFLMQFGYDFADYFAINPTDVYI